MDQALYTCTVYSTPVQCTVLVRAYDCTPVQVCSTRLANISHKETLACLNIGKTASKDSDDYDDGFTNLSHTGCPEKNGDL